jgi:hypothetical protein
MESTAKFIRPTLSDAVIAWRKILAERGFSNDLLWLFEENLCFEKLGTVPGGFRFGFQTRFAPPTEDALDIAFDHFCESDAQIVFYRIGESRGRSLSILLCDSWFNQKCESEGFLRRDDWGVSFHAGQKDEIEEITELSRWLRRVKRGRGFHDLDFCMALATIDEIKIHGRPLAHYERFAGAMLKRLRRLVGEPN